MDIKIENCLKLAINGGPEKERNRGLTLDLKNLYVDHIFDTLTNIDLLIESQQCVTDYSKKVYGIGTVGYNSDKRLLDSLLELKNKGPELSKQQIVKSMIELLVEFKDS